MQQGQPGEPGSGAVSCSGIAAPADVSTGEQERVVAVATRLIELADVSANNSPVIGWGSLVV